MRRGEVVQLGRHRLMCGDAGNPEDVAKLFDGTVPDLVFTSPPYTATQRDYGSEIKCWDTLMQRVFGAVPHHEKTQVLVNLGMVHRKGEWVAYWDSWIEWMRSQGWRRFGWYVVDKVCALPGHFGGRPQPRHEFIFHFIKPRGARINKFIRCNRAGAINAGGNWSNGWAPNKTRRTTGALKSIDSIISSPIRHSDPWHGGHPAVFPVSLPVQIYHSFSDVTQNVYDPFSGSAGSMLAAEQTGRISYCMELEPKYCDLAIKRWERRKPVQTELSLGA